MKKIGVIFDIDGTLWDSSYEVAASWQQTVDKTPGVDRRITRDDIMGAMGKTMDEFGELFFPNLPMDERKKVMKACEEEENAYLLKHRPVPYEGAVETLTALSREYPLFIVSNCQEGYIDCFIEIAGLEEAITDYVSFGDNRLPKGDNIRLIANRNGLDEYFYLGDIQGDYDATLAGGGRFIHAAYGFGAIKEETPRIQDIRELPAVLKELIK